MALPAIFRRLFRDNGYSSLLKPEIVPITNDAASSATDVAASPSLVRSVASNYIESLSVSGQVITYTKGSGTTGTLTTQDTTYAVATTSANGLMSKDDKSKLNGIKAGAGLYTLFATYTNSGDKTITGCTVGQLLLFLYSMGKTSRSQDTGGWIKVKSGASAGTTTGGHFWLGTEADPERRSTNIFATIPTATTVVVNLAGIGDDNPTDKIYVYR